MAGARRCPYCKAPLAGRVDDPEARCPLCAGLIVPLRRSGRRELAISLILAAILAVLALVAAYHVWQFCEAMESLGHMGGWGST